MTANHAHTPTMDQIRDDFIEAWAGHFRDGDKGAAEYFDQALSTHNARIEAAAEQRGAVKALRSAAQFFSDPGGERFASWAAIQQYLNDRADQIEGDDEKH